MASSVSPIASEEAEEDFPDDNIPDEVLVEHSEKPLSAAMRARIERNRQRALMLRQARLNSKPYSKPNGQSIMKVCRSEIDTGAGFFLDEDQEKDLKNQKVIYEEAPSLLIDSCNCENCDQKFTESYLLKNFECFVCDSCREENNEKYNLITKTDAKTKYLLNDVDLDKREPKLKFIVRKNPHNPRWGDMKLYLESQVKRRAIDVWESEEKIEAAKEAKTEKRVNMKKKKFNKKMKELRMSVRSNLWQKQTSTHQHSYGEESYDEEEDMYSKTCTTCGNVMTYEKM
ncbi:DNA repair protein complementing XP-A cells homolog [Octopus bimaculoides]|uniref:XPA C-terminal domain-containing protein n=1 Tax=Octopus bimaculoides TaxID=37653 RepID=A0A0L8GHR5_OCTBM|nr:DNA repair protein complementing XP-A cells homolog [Octopus bimaculoides]|eukprot:XP_014780939.1 PREDICTED: DNA repair protein complementing XP-A cells homolog [Octopus bimaculoides]